MCGASFDPLAAPPPPPGQVCFVLKDTSLQISDLTAVLTTSCTNILDGSAPPRLDEKTEVPGGASRGVGSWS